MKRVILDTNIYGRIVERGVEEKIKMALSRKKDIVVYGFEVIRKELRASSQEIRVGKKRLRLALLAVYDTLTNRHNLDNSSLITKLALDYYDVYEQLGGKESKDGIINDFLIVACGTLHEMDIVISDDNRTMFNAYSIKAYKIVNKLRNYKTPNFIGYDAFGRSLS